MMPTFFSYLTLFKFCPNANFKVTTWQARLQNEIIVFIYASLFPTVSKFREIMYFKASISAYLILIFICMKNGK